VDHGSEVGHGRREAMSVEADMIREPRRAPERPMSGPEGARPQSRARVLRGGPEQNDGSTLQSSASAENSSNMDQTLSSLQPNDSSACSTPALNERLYMPPSLEKRSSPYALLGSSLNLPFNADTALVKSARSRYSTTYSQAPKGVWITKMHFPVKHGGVATSPNFSMSSLAEPADLKDLFHVSLSHTIGL
jgi:hypothetical protein